MTGRLIRGYVRPTQIGGVFAVAPTPELRSISIKLTRRQLLTGGAAVVVATASALRLRPGPGRVTFDLRPTRATVLLDGKPVWVTDVASFQGSTRLTHSRSVGHVCIALSGAEFPGSAVPAGFVAHCRRRRGRWELTLSTTLAGEFPTVDLAEWLQGRASLRTVTGTLTQHRLAGQGRLTIPAATALEWRPDGLHSWYAKEPIEITHAAWRTRSRRLIGGLAHTGSDTAASATWLKRAVWHLPASAVASCNSARTLKVGDRRLRIAESARAVVSLETGIAAGGRASAFTLESESGAIFATTDLKRSALTPVELPLERVRFVRTKLERATEARAEATTGPVWLEVDDAVFRVTSPKATAGFLAQSGTDLVATSSCQGAVEQIVLNAPGFDSALLTLVDPDGVGAGTDIAELVEAHKTCVVQLDNYNLHVERMADQLALDFGFVNMALVRVHGRLQFEALDPSRDVLLRVIFPPQHLQERAYFYQQIKENVPLDANDPKWQTCPPSNPACPDPLAAWQKILDPDMGPATGVNEFLNGRDIKETKARLAGQSRLVFAVPTKDSSTRKRALPAHPAASWLLNWNAFDPKLSARAAIPDVQDVGPAKDYSNAVVASLAPPDPNETAIEFPTDLFLSADRRGQWRHAIDSPGGMGGFGDLWHTQLLGSGVRALWATDFDANYFPTVTGRPAGVSKTSLHGHNSDTTARMPMDERDRHELVALTSVFGLKALAGTANVVKKSGPVRRCDNDPPDANGMYSVFMPQPVTVDHLSLSALGATARLKGKWDPPSDDHGSNCWDALSVEEWRHIASLGRDVYVRMVYKGYLLPIGIRASLVKVTERKFVRDLDPQFGDRRMKAVLMQRMFIVIGKPTKAFPALGEPDAGRDWPFDKVEFTTLVTPDIIDPYAANNLKCDPLLQPLQGAVFWPRVSTDEMVEFHYDVVKDGTRTSLISHLLFVDNTSVHNPGTLASVLDYYDCHLHTPDYTALADGEATTDSRIVLVGGSRLAYAPSRKPGDTQFETSTFEMMARRRGAGTDSHGAATNDDLIFTAALEAESQPPFYPAVDTAHIRVEAIRRLSGNAVDEVSVRFDREYLRDGFSTSANPGEIFLLLKEGNIRLNVAGNSSRAGGVATPNTLVIGLSRKIGLVGGDAILGGGPPFECNNGGTHALRVLASGAADSGETPNASLDAIRKGGFDPEAYFAATLGDAKLLGLIRLADLIKAATSLIDLDSAPRLLEHYQYQLSAEVIAQVQKLIAADGLLTKLHQQLEDIDTQAGNPAAVARLLQRLDVIIADIDKLAPTDDASLIASCTELMLAAKGFLTEIDNIGQDPSSLLPSALHDLLQYLNAVLGAVQRGNLTDLATLAKSIDVEKEPYLTIHNAIAPVRAPFQAAYVHAIKIRDDLQQQIDAGVSQLLDAVFPILGELFLRYCEVIDEAQCFYEALNAIKNQNRDITALNQALQSLASLPQNAVADLDTAVAQIDKAIRTQFTGYADVLQPIATRFKAAAEGIRSRLVALRDQIEAVTKKGSAAAADYVVVLGAQAQLVATVQAMEALVAAAVTEATPPPGQSPPPLVTDLQALNTPLTTIATHCSDGFTLLNTASPLGTQLDVVNTQLDQLFTAAGAGLGTVKARVDAAYRDMVTTVVANLKAQRNSEAVRLYLETRDTFVWAAGLLITARQCFGGQQCPVFDAVPQLRTQLSPLLVKMGKAIVDPLNDLVTFIQTHDGGSGRNSLLGSNLKKGLDDLAAAIQKYNGLSGTDTWTARASALQLVLTQARSVVDTIHTAIEHGSIASLVNVSELAHQALANLPLPTHLTLSYDWQTDLGAWPSGSPTFQPIDLGANPGPQTEGTAVDNAQLKISASTEIDLLSGKPPVSSVNGSISPFRVYLLNADLNFFAIDIQELGFTASPGQAAHYTVKIGKVTLGDAFEFVDALESLFGGQDEGNGFYSLISLDPPAIEVGYRFGFDVLELGEFAIENLRLALGFRLPFDNTPARLTFQVSTKELPCLIVATPYGGGFFFGMVARAGGGIESLEGAFEFGAMTVFQFGPLSGSGRVAAGFYFSCGPGGSTICGYVIAFGEATIAWFSLSVLLRVSVCSADGNVSGQADFEVTFRVSSFFKISFSFTAAYSFAGSGSHKANNALSHIHAQARLASAGGGGGAETCPAPPSQTPERCPKNVTRVILNDRFRHRRRYLGDLPRQGVAS